MLRLVVRADHELRNQPHEDELHANDDQHDGKQEERVVVRVWIRRQHLLHEDEHGEEKREAPQSKAGKTEEVHRLRRVAAQQLDGDQIEHHPRGA